MQFYLGSSGKALRRVAVHLGLNGGNIYLSICPPFLPDHLSKQIRESTRTRDTLLSSHFTGCVSARGQYKEPGPNMSV